MGNSAEEAADLYTKVESIFEELSKSHVIIVPTIVDVVDKPSQVCPHYYS